MVLLPQELLETIIDHVEDASTLRSGALAGSALLYPCQRNIFRQLRLFGGNSSWRPSLPGAALFFFSAPHLCGHVRDLTVALSQQHSDSAALRDIFGAFKNMERLNVLGGSIQWPSLDVGVTEAMLACLQRPSLRSFHLHALSHIPHSAMSVMLSVPAVGLAYATVHDAESATSYGRPELPTPRLRQLRLELTPGILPTYQFLSEHGYTAGLRRLELQMDSTISPQNNRIVMDLLGSCAGSLEEIWLGAGSRACPVSPLPNRSRALGWKSDPKSPLAPAFKQNHLHAHSLSSTNPSDGPPLAIPTLPRVRVARLAVPVGELWGNSQNTHPQDTLENVVKALPALEELALHFVAGPRLDILPMDVDQLCPLSEDVIFERPKLRRVRCLYVCWRQMDVSGMQGKEILERFTRAMEERMPRLVEEGKLVCEIVSERGRLVP